MIRIKATHRYLVPATADSFSEDEGDIDGMAELHIVNMIHALLLDVNRHTTSQALQRLSAMKGAVPGTTLYMPFQISPLTQEKDSIRCVREYIVQ